MTVEAGVDPGFCPSQALKAWIATKHARQKQVLLRLSSSLAFGIGAWCGLR